MEELEHLEFAAIVQVLQRHREIEGLGRDRRDFRRKRIPGGETADQAGRGGNAGGRP
jgi:hypothetical protein